MNKEKFYYLGAAAGILMLLSGCGNATAVTTVKLNPDMSGSRTIVYTDNYNEDKQYINGDPQMMLDQINAACPAEMTCAEEFSNGIIKYTFTIDFTSLDDYKAKVKAIRQSEGHGSDPNITYISNDTPFVSGSYYDESFSTSDLLEWMQSVLSEGGYVSGSNINYYIGSSEYYYVYNGSEPQKSDDTSSVSKNTLNRIVLDNIDIKTTLNEDSTFNRTILLSIAGSKYSMAKESIDAYLNSHVSERVTGSWQTDGGSMVYTITGENLSADEMNEMTSTFLGYDTGLTVSDCSSVVLSDLSIGTNLNEKLNFSNYTTGSKTQIRYLYDMRANLEGSVLTNGDTSTFSYQADNNPDYQYYKIIEKEISNAEISMTATKPVAVNDLHIVTTVGNKNKISRTVQLSYQDRISDSMAEKLKENISASTKDGQIKLEDFSNQDALAMTLSSDKLSAAADSKAWAALTGQEECTNSRVEETLLSPLTGEYKVKFNDETMMRGFSSFPIATMTYEVRGLGNEIKSDYETGSIADGVYTIQATDVSPSDRIEVSLSGKKTNILYPLTLGLIIAAACLIIGLVIRMRKNAAKMNQSARKFSSSGPSGSDGEQQEKKTASSEAASSAAGTEQTPSTVTCPHCGHQNKAGTMFCEQCGTSLFAADGDDQKEDTGHTPETDTDQDEPGNDDEVADDHTEPGSEIDHSPEPENADEEPSGQPADSPLTDSGATLENPDQPADEPADEAEAEDGEPDEQETETDAEQQTSVDGDTDLTEAIAMAEKANQARQDCLVYSTLIDQIAKAAPTEKREFLKEVVEKIRLGESYIRTSPDDAASNYRKAVEKFATGILQENGIATEALNDKGKNEQLTSYQMFKVISEKGLINNRNIINCLYSVKNIGNPAAHDNVYPVTAGENDSCVSELMTYIILADYLKLDSVLQKPQIQAISSYGDRRARLVKPDFIKDHPEFQLPEARDETRDGRPSADLLEIFSQMPIKDYRIVQRYQKESYEDPIGKYLYKAVDRYNGGIAYKYIVPIRKAENDQSDREKLVQTVIHDMPKQMEGFLDGDVKETGKGMYWDYMIYSIKPHTETLDYFKNGEPLSAGETLDIVRQLAETLNTCWQKFNHRGITPHAVFVTDYGDKRIAELGRLDNMKVDNLANNTQTISTDILERALKNRSNFLYISVKMLNESVIREFTSEQWQRVDVYSLTVLLAYCLDRKSGLEPVHMDTYGSGYSQTFADFCKKVISSNIAGIPSLKELITAIKEEMKVSSDE